MRAASVTTRPRASGFSGGWRNGVSVCGSASENGLGAPFQHLVAFQLDVRTTRTVLDPGPSVRRGALRSEPTADAVLLTAGVQAGACNCAAVSLLTDVPG